MIKNFIKEKILIADGAMGTYYSDITSDSVNRVEEANIKNHKVILDIHKKYIENGSKLIRTNTFSANTVSLNISRGVLKEIIDSGCDLALEAALDKNVYVAGNIGPIPQILSDGSQVTDKDIIDEYKFIIDCFVGKNITIFNLETFSSTEFIDEIVEYIRASVKDVFIMLQFSITKSGYSRKGIYIEDIVKKTDNVDVLGFNCGSGPTHLLNNIKKIDSTFPLSVYANAGYPEIINHRTVFNSDPEYFAGIVLQTIEYGAKIIGGCCGTSPEYIKNISMLLSGKKVKKLPRKTNHQKLQSENTKKNSDLIIAVELDPPFEPDLTKILKSAQELKDIGIDFITVADSPSGRMRLNPIITASRIKREVDIDVMPHICCRDRNLIALKSDILAAHTEDIRKILVITGDPIPQEERDEVKKVFNCNSVTLMKQITEFNTSILKESKFQIGGALNLSARNLDVQVKKMENKIEAGATLFLTQPIYDTRSIDFLLNIKKREGVKILAGILPLVTYKNAQFLNNEFPGITIPEDLIARFDPGMSREEAQTVGVDISVDIVNRLKASVDGFYFITPFFRTGMIKDIIKRSLN